MPPVYEWDELNTRANLKKHGIDFAEATLVFADKLAQIFQTRITQRRSSERSSLATAGSTRSWWYPFTERRRDLIRIISLSGRRTGSTTLRLNRIGSPVAFVRAAFQCFWTRMWQSFSQLERR